MASGKLSPRQKMINMMYLVLTAMLALNISKDILDALTKLNESLGQTVETVEGKNSSIYGKFDKAYNDNPAKVKKWRDMALEVQAESNKLNDHLEGLKSSLIEVSGGVDEETGLPKKLDAREPPANYLLNEGHGTELKKMIESYRAKLVTLAGDNEQIKKDILSRFNTDKQKVGDAEAEWEKASFEHFPLAAILPFLTDIQAKVRNTESEVISQLQLNITEGDIPFTTVRAVVVPRTNYVTQGDEYEAEVYLAAYDDTKDPVIEIERGGSKVALDAENIADGIGKVRFKADAVGEQKWGGVIKIIQVGVGEREFTIPEQTFTIAPPSVVISPTKMNVLYRGVDNPLEIGVPGVDPAKIRVSGPGVSGSNGKYTANVTNISGTKTIKIGVSVEETKEDGTTEMRSVGSKEFRIKGLPPAVGSIYKKSEGSIGRSLLKSGKISADFLDFPFEMQLAVTSFEVVIPGFPPERVRGNTMTSSVKTRIDKMKPGQTVTIRNIKAKGPKGVKIPRVAAISLDLQ